MVEKQNFIVIKSGNYKIKILKEDIEIIDGYIPVIDLKNLGDDKVEVITGVLDENFNVIVPLRKEIVSIDDFNIYNYNNDIDIYENKKAIYKVEDNEYYIIDLTNVQFVKENNKLIPKKYIKKIENYYALDDSKIIAYLNNNEAYIYDVINDKQVGNVYNLIIPNEENTNEFSAYYQINNKYVDPLYIRFTINEKGKVLDDVVLNEEITIIVPRNILNIKDKLIKYCDDNFNLYLESSEDDYGKVLQ